MILSYNTGAAFTHGGHFGYSTGDLDGLNNVFSVDAKHTPFLGTKISAQVATSESSFDRSNEDFYRARGGTRIWFQ